MTDKTINEILRATKARPYGGRGAVYRELRANYHKLAACLKETEPAWEVIAAAMARTGVVGAKGNPSNRKSLPKVWGRVCRDVAAEEALRLTGVPRVPARRRNTAPTGWHPPAFAQISQVSAPPTSGSGRQGDQPTAPCAAPLSQQQPAPSPDRIAAAAGPVASPTGTPWRGRPEDEPSTAVPGTVEAIRESKRLVMAALLAWG